MVHDEALALIAAIQAELDDLRAYVLAQKASATVTGAAAAGMGAVTAKGTATVKTGRPASGKAAGTVKTTGTIWIEPMPWMQAGVMQGDMR